MKKNETRSLLKVFVMSFLVLAVSQQTFAMHIMEGFLAPKWSIFWLVISLPFVILGFFQIKKKVEIEPKALVLLALCGAFAFVLSSLKIPSVTGSCSHPTGVGLGAIIFGPLIMSIVSVIILLFQAILLAHGGVTTLGANVFSMGIIGPILSYTIYKIWQKKGWNISVGVFLAASLGNMMTYIVTSGQLAMAYPTDGSIITSLWKFLTIFALTQIPLAISEGLLTVVIFNVLRKYSGIELKKLSVI